MLPRMKCVVTAGPTYEPLDEVRRLTNFSTGNLGSGLANFLTERGHEVVLLIGYYAIHRGEQKARSVATFTSTADLRARLQALSTDGSSCLSLDAMWGIYLMASLTPTYLSVGHGIEIIKDRLISPPQQPAGPGHCRRGDAGEA